MYKRQILRGRFGFDGAIFSDDLSMEAGRYIDGELLSFADAALAALGAGCDLALLCNQSIGEGRPLDEFLDGFEAAERAGRWQPGAEARASEARRRGLLPQGGPVDWQALTRSRGYLDARRLLDI